MQWFCLVCLKERNVGSAQVWKINVSLKSRNCLWLVLANKILTLDNLQKWSWEGPSICTLCMDRQESVLHLFLSCHFSKSVWDTVKTLTEGKGEWSSDSIEGGLERRMYDKEVPNHHSLPTVIWAIWSARNVVVFKNKLQSKVFLPNKKSLFPTDCCTSCISKNQNVQTRATSKFQDEG